jgi:hypothetical protein
LLAPARIVCTIWKTRIASGAPRDVAVAGMSGAISRVPVAIDVAIDIALARS